MLVVGIGVAVDGKAYQLTVGTYTDAILTVNGLILQMCPQEHTFYGRLLIQTD